MLQKTGGILTIDGLDTSKPAEYLQDSNTPNCQNMSVNRSVLHKRVGLSLMGTTMSQAVMGAREFDRQGVKYVVRVGTVNVHEWNAVTVTWDNITGSNLTASSADTVSFATPLLSGSRILTFTNFVDNIRKYTGTGNSADLGGTPPKAKFLQEYGTYLLLAYVNDGGTVYPARVQWCDTGAPETWSGGNAGSKDLTEDGENITGMASYGDFVAVHNQKAIYLGYLVTTSTVFKFDRKNTGAGTIANNSIQNLPTGEQAFLANDGIRLFNGISAPLVESPVTDDIREGLNTAYVSAVWSVVVQELDEYWLGVPLGSQTTGDTVFKYNYRTKACHKDTRTSMISAFKFTQVVQPTWEDQTLTWDQQTARWDDLTLSSLFPIVVLNDANGLSLKRDIAVNDDNSVLVTAFWESRDFQSKEIGRLCRWVGMELFAKGNTVIVEYSTDSGETWTAAQNSPFTLVTTYPTDASPIRVYFDVVASKIRFRFKNATAAQTFYLKQFIVQYMDRELRGY